ncbi:TVP38/TMEM64 family protein [Laceyella putida]|uniref:TVP38/TMEM64 family membrane protein n=1 Tax=Laceyella putida TaxID=110101 RepID=A0ABW2RKZ2_9BACL
MEQTLSLFFQELGWWALPVSLIIGISCQLVGVLPTLFITTANVLYFGPWIGGLLSWFTELIGSLLAFALVRRGIKRFHFQRHEHWKWIQSMGRLSPGEQTWTLTLARILPFIPSGAVNMAGAMTTVSPSSFFWATALGKIPSTVLETLVSYQLLQLDPWLIQLIFGALLLALGLSLLYKRRRDNMGTPKGEATDIMTGDR